MLTNFDIYRYKLAGLSNRGIMNLVKFYRQHDNKKINLRQIGQVANAKSVPDFMEKYKSQDVKGLLEKFRRFPSFSILDEDVYPERLREIYDAPALLFYQGNLKLLKKLKIAFVGSRDASAMAIKEVKKLIGDLPEDYVIVSGLARGIDAASHIAAIKSGKKTIAVIGNGLDVYYPPENKAMQNYLAQYDLVLSEYGPGEPPLRFHFPCRNRIIAGLSRGIVVTEAKVRSGSLITAERGLEEGRDIFAVPGNIVDGHSTGCHMLIQQGAKLVFSAQDIVEEYAFLL